MKIVNKNVDELIPYINNPRLNDNAVDAVASSIKNFGFKVPIVIDSDNEIVTGHTRLKAAKKLGLEEVPCIVADDLTPEKIKAFRLADNKVAEISDWDFELLESELEELEMLELDFDIQELGFDNALPEINIEGMYEAHIESYEDKMDDSFLKWRNSKVEISEEEIERLDILKSTWNKESSFLEHILENFNEINVS